MDNGVYIIAELSANHGNSFEQAKETIKAMAKAGADAVKVQTYTADSLTLNIDNEFFGRIKEGHWKGLKPYDLFTEGAMPYEWQPKLKMIAEDLGLDFFSSPFDRAGVDFLESINISKYKIASFEITDINLIEYVASKGKPMIMSTGVAEYEDIKLAVETCRKVGNDDITLLKCTSEYPAPIENANLLTISHLKETFGVKVGVSDHTIGFIVPLVAVALGARVVEKHFILDKNLGGPDAGFSMEPKEFSEMVNKIRDVEKTLGNVVYDVSEFNKLRRRSLFISEDIKKGELITEKNIKSVRPGHGLHPKYFKKIIGKSVNYNLKRGTPFSLDLLS
jgi:pseudaminic acid synthase